MATVSYFFGYGAYRDKERLRGILQKNPRGGYGAVALNFDLAIQTLDQVTGNAKKVMEKVWGKGFKAYTLKPGRGEVCGVVWELEEKNLKILYEWNFINDWRKFEIIKVKKFNGELLEAITEKVSDDSPIHEIVDGINYPDNLNGPRLEEKNIELKENDEYKIEEISKILKELKSLSTP